MAHEAKSADEMAAEIKTAFSKSIDEVKGIAEDAIGRAEKGEQLTREVKERADEALLKMNGLSEQVKELDQKLARVSFAEEPEKKTAGEQFLDADEVKRWLDSNPSHGKIDLKLKNTITNLTTDADGSVGAGVAVTRLPVMLTLPQRRMTIRDLLTPGRMDGNTLEYVQETGFNNNAAPVAEGDKKPGSDLKLGQKTTTAKVLAHWMKVSRQALEDNQQLRSIIDQRLLYGLAYAEEKQLLNGDGTGQNLHGIIPQATAYSPAFSAAAETPIDKVRLMMLQAALAEYPATGAVMHPIDWAKIETTKDSEGRYIIGNPRGEVGPMLWGLPIVTTQAIDAGKTLVGAFRLGAQIFDRWSTRIEIGFENDDFTRNLVTVLAEERLALAVYRPEAFVYGDLA